MSAPTSSAALRVFYLSRWQFRRWDEACGAAGVGDVVGEPLLEAVLLPPGFDADEDDEKDAGRRNPAAFGPHAECDREEEESAVDRVADVPVKPRRAQLGVFVGERRGAQTPAECSGGDDHD